MVNKYQAGGAAQGSILQEIAKLPQDQQKKIMTAFGKWAQAKGLNIQQLQGNEQALEQAMGQFLQEMQASQAPKARLGAKLNYIRDLKGNAPEGMEVVYYKCGGQMKKKFVKAAGGAKAKDGKKEIADFKKKKACGGVKMKFQQGGKKSLVQESDTVHVNGQPRSLTNSDGTKVNPKSHWNGKMYNSKDKGNDAAYESFRDNMNEASAQLPTDKSPKHLGWEKNNPTSNEMRGKDREIYQQGTESVLPGITIIGVRRQPKKQTKKQPNYQVRYNVPMGAIEYVGRDGKQYWMRQDHSNGQYYYIDRSQPISYAKQVVPEGYVIPGANLKIGKGTNIGKLALGLEKRYF